jgi:hypothetical protein
MSSQVVSIFGPLEPDTYARSCTLLHFFALAQTAILLESDSSTLFRKKRGVPLTGRCEKKYLKNWMDAACGAPHRFYLA